VGKVGQFSVQLNNRQLTFQAQAALALLGSANATVDDCLFHIASLFVSFVNDHLLMTRSIASPTLKAQ
jgi:hypothetical protein